MECPEGFRPGPLVDAMSALLEAMEREQIADRIRHTDHTVWQDDPTEITNRLGWLDSPAEMVSRVGCISGGAAPMMDQVVSAGFDTFVTGETDHSCFHDAAEYGLNVIYGGHYATETLGVKALARHLAARFGLETIFLDLPTGM